MIKDNQTVRLRYITLQTCRVLSFLRTLLTKFRQKNHSWMVWHTQVRVVEIIDAPCTGLEQTRLLSLRCLRWCNVPFLPLSHTAFAFLDGLLFDSAILDCLQRRFSDSVRSLRGSSGILLQSVDGLCRFLNLFGFAR